MNKKKLLVVIVVLICILFVLSQLFGWFQESYRYRQIAIASSSPISAVIPAPNNIVMTDDNGVLTSLPFPKGMIMIWYGSLTDIPPGWVLCDGSNDTPDLRGRFVVGANPNEKRSSDLSLSIREIDAKGGSETHTLTVNELPKHSHPFRIGGGNDLNWNADSGGPFTLGADDVPRGTAMRNTEETGTGAGHNNMPPFYTLAYVMKI